MTPFSITYANSLFSLADEEQKSEAVLNDMQTVSEVLAQNPDYVLLLDSPTIRREERIALIDEAFSSADEYVLNFLKLLCEKKAVHLFGECFKQYVLQYNKKNNIESVTVITAAPLSEEQIIRLTAKLEKETGKTVKTDFKIDKSILGGIIIRTENSQTDSSVRARLDSLKKQLIGGNM